MEMAEKAKQNIAGSIAEYGKRLFGFIRSKVRSEEDAEDLL
jgi:DNA-directed RNA polymerase specialized sigma24 family protein